jgi:membrane protein DedA with SNARE-associated domain
MIERLISAITAFGHLGYLIIFIAAFLESSAFMGLLVPGESVVVLSGFLASQGYLEIGGLLWVVFPCTYGNGGPACRFVDRF